MAGPHRLRDRPCRKVWPRPLSDKRRAGRKDRKDCDEQDDRVEGARFQLRPGEQGSTREREHSRPRERYLQGPQVRSEPVTQAPCNSTVGSLERGEG